MNLERIKGKVVRILTDEFGAAEEGEGNHLIVTVEESLLDVSFIAHGDDTDDDETRIFLEVSSVICFDCPMSNELFTWVALNGSNYLVGNVALLPQGVQVSEEVESVGEKQLVDVIFRYRLPANDIDPSEIYVASYGEAESSRELRDLIPETFGGLTQ